MNLRISDFCHFVDGPNELVAIYNALTLGVVIVDSETASVLREAKHRIISDAEVQRLKSSGRGELLKHLIHHKLVFPLAQRVDLKDYNELQGVLNNKEIGILYLLLTDACNLACTYCFVENAMPNGHSFSKMSSGIARLGLDLFARELNGGKGMDEPQIIFYGGEPLSNFPVLKQALDYIAQLKSEQQLPFSTSITINTNGTLLNQEMISVLKQVENLSIAISLDGPKDINDLHRKYHNGKGTYNDIVRNYQLLLDNGIGAGLCCTITNQNAECLDEISRWFVEEMGVKSLGFNILIESKQVGTVRGEAELYAQNVAQKIVQSFRFFREVGVYEDRIMRKVEAFIEGYIYFQDCGGCGQQIVVSPTGMVGVCQGYWGTKKYFVQPNGEFMPSQHPFWEEWRHRSPLYMPQCRDCIALSICGGGCPYSADLRHGSIWELDDVFCVHAKATVKFLLQDLMDKMEQ